jgi:iron complex transport system permease protein
MHTRKTLLLVILALLTAGSLAYSLLSGSVDTGLDTLLAILSGNGDGLTRQIVLELRWPRTAAAFTTGALLAVAGALMQVLLRNPLADPYVLGISGGAATGALLSMLFGLGSWWLQGSAFFGALLSMLLVFGLSRGSGTWNTHRLLLTGVVIAAGWGAVIGFLLAISPDQGLRNMLFWLMGDLSRTGMPVVAAPALVIGLLIALAMGRSLNLLTRGDLAAQSLGVSVQALRVVIYLLASFMTALAVTLAGSVGFVGLVVPHLLRLSGVRDHRLLLPAAVLLGGSLLVIADTLARTLLAPNQLPVGILTAMVGVPLFLALLYFSRAQTGNRS